MSGDKRGTLLARPWLLIPAGAVLGILVAGGYTATATPVYSATARTFLSTTADATTGPDLANAQTFVSERIKSYSQLVTAPVVLDDVIRRLRLDTTPAKLAKQIEVTVPLNSVVIEVTATASDARGAASIANQVVDQLPAAVHAVEDPNNDKTDPVTFAIFDKAKPATDKSSPSLKLNLAAGLVIGLVVGYAAFYLVQRRTRGSIRTQGRGLLSARARASSRTSR